MVRRSVGEKRYLNEKGVPSPLFQANLLRGAEPVFVVEGVFDALSAEELSQYIRSHLGAKATPCATVADGVRTAIEHAGKDGVVCACGSLYMIGDIVAALDTL